MIVLGIDPGYAIVGCGVVEYKSNHFRVLDYGAITTEAHTPFNERIEKIFEMADKVYERNSYRIGTGLLNDVITDAVRLVTPPSYNGKRLKIYYSVQAEVNPPTFIIFANDSSLVHFSYKRYLENCIRKAFDFSGTPIRIFIRNQNEDEGIRR